METSPFKHFFENFCSNSPWNYAVFWKLHQLEVQTLLIYEDGYYDHNALQLRSRSKFRQFSGQEDLLNLGLVTDLLVGDVPEWPVAFESDVVSCHQYLLGQGLVGRVGLSGIDLWLYSDDSESMELTSYLENHPDEWLFPISAGIQTTLVASILPYGVLQLGSFERVAENFANVADIKERIISLMSTSMNSPSNSDKTPHLWSSILVPEWENKNESSFDPFHESHFQSAEAFDAAEFANFEISTGCEIIDPFQLEDFTTDSLFTSDMDICRLYLDLSIESNTLNEFIIPDIQEAFENIWEFTCHEGGDINTAISSESSSRASCEDSGPNREMLVDPEGHSRQTEPQESSRKTFESNLDYCNGLNLSEMSSCGWFDEGGDHDYLLEAAVASLYKNSEDTLSCLYNSSSKSNVNSLPELAPPFQVQNLFETNAAPTEQHVTVTIGQSISLSCQSTAFNNALTSPDSYEGFGSAIFKVEQPIGSANGFSLKNEKIPKLNKQCRVTSKTNLRPRPRDRQLIQDRLKQLRKLVPSATKSSIDGLLEQTTKHMMFLRSVTEQAEKVKQFTDEKFIADKNEANTRRPCRSQQGGNNTESSPIIVTDMEHAGQLLIQMLCNNDEVFFEMIEVMRQLNLTILQGVIENHRTNWARFIVEASEGFNRLDIFWPLMRILQRNGDWMTKLNEWCA